MTDTEIAKQVRDALRALNGVLKTAAQAGLYVEIDYVEACDIGPIPSYEIYMARVERRTVVHV
jgi:hypothetical protein